MNQLNFPFSISLSLCNSGATSLGLEKSRVGGAASSSCRVAQIK